MVFLFQKRSAPSVTVDAETKMLSNLRFQSTASTSMNLSRFLSSIGSTAEGLASGGNTSVNNNINSSVALSAAAASSALSAATSNAMTTSNGWFVCSVCGKSFMSRWELKRHLQTHADTRPFRCPYCSHRSNFKHNLKAHVRMVHGDLAFPLPRQQIEESRDQ